MQRFVSELVSNDWPPKASKPLALKMDEGSYGGKEDTLRALFSEAAAHVQVISSTNLNSAQQEAVAKELEKSMTSAICGSNLIDKIGMTRMLDFLLCRVVFTGQRTFDANPDSQRGHDSVVQHVRAYEYILREFVDKKKDLDEHVLRETNDILTFGIPTPRHPNDHKPVQPPGYVRCYREDGEYVHDAPRNARLPLADGDRIRSYIDEICRSLSIMLERAEVTGKIDPFAVAAKVSHQFLEVYPFRDGNGRMSRLILNAVLCRYAGVMVAMGIDKKDEEEYKRVTQMKGLGQHGEYAAFVLRKAAARLREMAKKVREN